MVLKGSRFNLYLDIDPAIGLARAKGRGELDRIEQEALGFFGVLVVLKLKLIVVSKQWMPTKQCPRCMRQ